MDFRAYFVCIFDLLEQDMHPCYLAVADVLEKNPSRPFFLFHPLRYLFEGYRDLLLGHLSLEDFMALGDVTSTRTLSLFPSPLDAELSFAVFCQQVQKAPSSYQDALVLVLGDEKKCNLDMSVGASMQNLGITLVFDASA